MIGRMRDWVVWWVFWSQPRRRWMITLTRWRRCPVRLKAWLLDQLVPTDAAVTFGEESS